jgi:hypothetical protein
MVQIIAMPASRSQLSSQPMREPGVMGERIDRQLLNAGVARHEPENSSVCSKECRLGDRPEFSVRLFLTRPVALSLGKNA